MQRFAKGFYTRDVLVVATELLGQYLVRKFPDGAIERYVVTEVEAYKGGYDRACHASKGKTARTSIMFSDGGYMYIYLIYGLYWMLNVVTGPLDQPQALLIRAVKGCYGPGRLTRKLGVDRTFYGEDLTTSERLWFESSNYKPEVYTGPRIGVDYAGEYWSAVPWRFYIDPEII